MRILKRARTRYILHRYAINHSLWEETTSKLPLLCGMSSVEKAHLRELSTLFLHGKNIVGVRDFQLTEEMRLMVAVQACLPILALGIELFNTWRDVIVYPGAFQVSRDERDEFGIVHHERHLLSGESWLRGPVIFSWQDIEKDKQRGRLGHNVVIHEIAHKLDGLNGTANGMPPLHIAMPPEQWAATFSEAYQLLTRRLEHHQRVCINPYAATNPAEFFAVFSEYFFCAPDVLEKHFVNVYQLLQLYYRQDPLGRAGENSQFLSPLAKSLASEKW